MKITDIKNSHLPIKVKLNSNFSLEESVDVHSIVQINSYCVLNGYDEGDCFSVKITLLAEDYKYNKSIASTGWYNGENGKYDLDFFEYNKIKPNTDYKEEIFVMEHDDCFDLIEPENDNTELIDLLGECKLQLEYLNNKFQETGTSNSLISRIEIILNKK
jgi:hypothetical protein